MDLKKIAIFLFLVLLINLVIAQDLPETIITDSGEVGKIQQQQLSQVEILQQIIIINEKLDTIATKDESVAIAQQLNEFSDERINNLIILTVLIHLSTIAGAFGTYLFLKSRKRI